MIMNDAKEKILQLIRIKGPVIPAQISKEINTNILMASAYLSELSSNNLVKISNIKIGDSPLYYLPGQEHRLQDFANKLHEKEKKSYDLLKQNKVLRDTSLDPVSRVTLRNMKDFAFPLKVDYQDKSEIFWKWYLLPNKEAEDLIKIELMPSTKTEEKEKKKEVQKPLKEDEQKEIKTVKKEVTLTDEFHDKIQQYFSRNKINIIDKKIIRKNKDIEMLVEIPSPVGNLKYFCKAKKKKKINDGDLSSVYIQGQSKKLPVLFITTGELTKKANELLEKEFKGLKVKQL